MRNIIRNIYVISNTFILALGLYYPILIKKQKELHSKSVNKTFLQFVS